MEYHSILSHEYDIIIDCNVRWKFYSQYVVDGLNNFEKLYTHVNGKIEIFWIKGLCSSDVNSHLKPYIRLQSIRITPKVFKYALRKNSVIYQVEY